MLEEDAVMAAAASSECSSGCQSGWTTYLDTSSYSLGTARLRGKAQCPSSYHCGHSEEEDDLSMISDASSGPRQQLSAGPDEGAAALANAQRAERRRRTKEPAAARWQSKVAAVASTLLEDTASSPAFFKHSAKQVMGSPEANGYGGGGAGSMMNTSNAADFSSTFFSATGFESPMRGSPLGGRYLQVQYSPAPAKPMPTSHQACRDGGDKMERW